MADEQQPFADVQLLEDGLSLPELKWRELLFIGALRTERDVPRAERDVPRTERDVPRTERDVPQTNGTAFVRDPSRPLPPFRIPELFPEGVRFRASREGRRVVLRRVAG
jgi:hypothetical protein